MSKLKTISDFEILRNDSLGSGYYLLTTRPGKGEFLKIVQPGQFVEISVPDCNDVFLRRPISICMADPDSGIMTLLIKAVGDGTKKLCSLGRGGKFNAVWPLGQGFEIPEKGESEGDEYLLIGGGVGVAPLLLAGKKLKEAGCKVTFLLGARTVSQLVMLDEFAKYGEVETCTDDGTAGVHGTVAVHPALKKNNWAKIYTCGPTPMMKAVAKIAKKLNVSCHASLENMMACGLGACLGCVQATTGGNICVCSNGPVFDTADLLWD